MNWVITRGVKGIDNIIRVALFRHYEHSLSTYQLLALGYIDTAQTQLGIFEAEEVYIENNYEGIAVNILSKHWTIKTNLFKAAQPAIVGLVRIENDLILMSRVEYEKLTNQEERSNGRKN